MKKWNGKIKMRIVALLLVMVETLSLLANVAYGNTDSDVATGTSLVSATEPAQDAPEDASPDADEDPDEAPGAEDASPEGEDALIAEAPEGDTAPDGDAVPEGDTLSPEEAAAPAEEKILRARITGADGVSYEVTVTYGDEAALPEDVELALRLMLPAPEGAEAQEAAAQGRPYATERFVDAQTMAAWNNGLRETLEVADSDYVFYTGLLDVTLTSGGIAVQPNAPVSITVETDAIAQEAAESVELAMLAPVQRWDEDAQAYVDAVEGTALAAENETEAPTGADDTARLQFTADTLTTLGIMGVAGEKAVQQVQGVTLTVYGPRGGDWAVRGAAPRGLSDGVEDLRSFYVEKVQSELPADEQEADTLVSEIPAALWLTAAVTGETPDLWGRGGLQGWRTDAHGAHEALFGAEGTAEPAAFRAGDVVSVLWDTGLRTAERRFGPVSVRGLMPGGATLTAVDVTALYDDPQTFTGLDDRFARTVAAYELNITADGETYLPGEARPVTVIVSHSAIAPGKAITVWHVTEGGAAEMDATLADGAVTFRATEGGVYVVVNSSRETTVTASDGHTYEIAVTYTAEAAIPADAALTVRELTGREYALYYYRTQAKVGMDAFDTMRAFDIGFTLPSGETVEPAAEVGVSIRMLDRSTALENTRVVHYGADGTEIITPVVSDGGATLDFTAGGFSVYVVIGHEGDTKVENARVEFHFLSQVYHDRSESGYSSLDVDEYEAGYYGFMNRGGTYQTSQVLKSGEALEMITNPPNIRVNGQDKYFFGWYVVTPSATAPVNDGDFVYTWADDPKEISFEKAMSIAETGVLNVGGTIHWTINGVSGTAVLDAEGTAHVYLAPIYEDYYFINYHLGARDSDIWSTVMNRRLIVLGSDGLAVVHIGDQKAPSTDATRQVFAGWETVETEQKKDGSDVPVWLVHNNVTDKDEEVAAETCPEGGTPVMIPVSTKQLFQSVDPVTGTEQTATVYATDGSAYSPAEASGYHIVIRESDLIGNSIDLYPVFAQARCIMFNLGKSGNGATYVPSQYLLTSDLTQNGNYESTYYVTKLPEGEQPLRNGYQFMGWYADAAQDQSTGDITNLTQPQEVVFTRSDGSSFTETLTARQITDANGIIVAEDFQKKITDGGVEKLLYEVKNGKLYVYEEMESLTLYALWKEVDDTTVTVNVWRQKVTDDVDAADDEKSYDYDKDYSYVIAAQSGKDVAWLRSNNKLRLNGTGVNVEGQTNTGDFVGFQWRTTAMSTNAIAGDGTTVVNIYYDRYIRTLTFQDNSSSTYAYTLTTGNNTPQFAFMDGQIVELTRVGDSAPYTWVIPEYGYQYVENSEGGFVKVGDTYVPLVPVTEETTTYTANYRYTRVTNNKGTQYGIDSDSNYQELSRLDYLYTPYSGTPTGGTYYGWYDDAFVTLYYNNGTWYRTRSGFVGVYWYSNPYTGVFYSRSNQNNTYYIGPDRYTGNRYTRANDGSTDVTNNVTLNTAEPYYIDGNGGKVPVTAHTTTTITGYKYDNNGTEVIYTNEQRYSYDYVEISSTTYNGDRYSRANGTTSWHTVYVIKALYGQYIGNHFPIPGYNDGRRWQPQNSSTYNEVLVYIDAMPNESITFRINSTENKMKTLYYYVEALPGETAATTVDGIRYRLYTTINARYGFFTYSEDFMEIEGFSRNFSNPAFESNGQVTADELRLYYTRNSYTLTYVDNYPNIAGLTYTGSGGASSGHTETLTYESSLAGYDSKYTPHAPDHYNFQGWYEDAACTVKFNFNSTMPAGDKIIYAGWKAEKFRINIDPNGGEIDHINHNQYPNGSYSGLTMENGDLLASFRNDNTGYRTDRSTYFNGTYNEQVGYYDMDGARRYVEITDVEANSLGAGNWYYYLNTQTKPTDGSKLPNDLHNALYLTEAEIDSYYDFYVSLIVYDLERGEITDTTVLSKNQWMDVYLKKNATGGFQKYRPIHGTEFYTFLGWYKVLYDEDGNEIGPDSMPYNFSDPIREPMTIRAYWRLDGGYRILYTPYYTMPDGTVINGTMETWTDPQVATATYADGARTNIYRQPTGLTANGSEADGEDYLFRGWQLVSVKTVNGNPVYTPLENNVYYDPGDAFTVAAGYADENSIIHFQAVYEKKSESYRRPEVAALTLDANSGFLTTDGTNPSEGSAQLDWSNGGKVYLDYSTEKMIFGYYNDPMSNHIQTGNTVHLYQYATELTKNSAGATLDPSGTNYFRHPDGYLLVGFDDEADENDFVATYPADSIISVQRTDNKTLYAVWEPMVYLNIRNETKDLEAGSEGGPITISLSSADESALYVVNERTGLYDRVPISDLGNITIAEGETLRLAMPYGKDHPVTVSGTNNLGTGILLYWQGDLNGLTDGHSNGQAKNGETFSATERLVEDETGVTVTFRSLKAQYTLVMDDNWSGGMKAEEYFNTDYGTAYYVDNSYTLPLPSTRLGFEFIGWDPDQNWATTHTNESDVPAYPSTYRVISSLSNDIFHVGAGNETRVETLYAVWRGRSEPNTVYVYKDVPEPGRSDREFAFTVSGTVDFKPQSGSATTKSFTQSYTLHDDQYLMIYTKKYANTSSADAYVEVIISKYTVGSNGAGDVLEGTPITIRKTWSNTKNEKTGTFQNFRMTVSETDYSAAPDYYDTSLEIAAQNTNPLTKQNNYQVYWEDDSAGGTVIFTNTRQTVDVTVKKMLEGHNIAAGFTFGVSYTADGVNTTRDDITVTSGSTTGTIIEKVPVGATLTLTEKGTDLLDYETTAKQGDTSLDVTSTSTTTGGTTTYHRAVTINVTEAATVTFTNVLKSVPVKIIKVGYDGTNTYTDVEAQFTMSQGISNVFTGRYARPVNATTPRGNILFETGQIYSGSTEDPVLYVGEYTLTETRLWGDYISLDDETTISVSGTADGAEVTVSGKSASVEKVGSVWVVTVTNRKTADITVKAGLLDPMIDQRTFTFSGSYTLDGKSYQIDSFALIAYSTNDGSVAGAQEPKTLAIPIGATDLKIWEDTTGSSYDTTVEHNNDGRADSDTYQYTAAFAAGNAGDVITFYNKKQTVNITVKKIVESDDKTGTFVFTATLLNGEIPITGYPIFINSTPLVDTDDEYTNSPTGEYPFTLANNGEIVLTIPVGSRLKIQETGVTDHTEGNDLDLFSTSVATTYTDGGATYESTSWVEDTRLYTLTSAPSTALTVTFTNAPGGERQVILRKVDGADMRTALNGATFTLRRGSTNVATGLQSDHNGVFYVGTLRVGKYTLVEDTAPSGYRTRTFKLTVPKTGEVTVTVVS